MQNELPYSSPWKVVPFRGTKFAYSVISVPLSLLIAKNLSKTMISVLALLSVSLTTAIDLSCKGVAYEISGVTTIYPMDVCYSSTVSTVGNVSNFASSLFYCSSDGEAMLATYLTSDCSGYPFSAPVNIDQSYPTQGYTVTNGCSKGLPQCDYVKVRTYTLTAGCDSNSTIGNFRVYSEIPYIANDCMNLVVGTSSYKFTCDTSSGSATYQVWSNNNCNGNASQIVDYKGLSTSIDCDDKTSTGVSLTTTTRVECGTASFTGLLYEDKPTTTDGTAVTSDDDITTTNDGATTAPGPDDDATTTDDEGIKDPSDANDLGIIVMYVMVALIGFVIY